MNMSRVIVAGGLRIDRAIGVIGFAPFDFDLDRCVIDVKMMGQFLGDSPKHLLPFPNALLGDHEMTGAGDHAGSQRPDMQIVQVDHAAHPANCPADGVHIQRRGAASSSTLMDSLSTSQEL